MVIRFIGLDFGGHSDEGVKQNNPVNCFAARESLRGENEFAKFEPVER